MPRRTGFEHPEAITPQEARWTSNMRPVRQRKALSTKVKKWIIRGALALFVMCVVVAIVAASNASQSANEARQRFDDSYNPSFKVRYADLGRQVLLNWYNQDEPVVDVASGVSWPGEELTGDQGLAQSSQDQQIQNKSSRIIPDLRHIMFLSGSQSSKTLDPSISNRYPQYRNPYEETNTYYVVMNNQAVTVTITLIIPDLEDPSLAPVLVAPPVIQAADKVGNARSEISSDPVGVGGIKESRVSSDVESIVKLWASAWSSNDSVSLKSITNDSSDRAYFGLGGWSTDPSSVRINWSYYRINPEDTQDKSTVIMEVEFVVFQQNKSRRRSQESSDDTSGINERTQFSNVQTMNLLVKNADSGRPAVTAWGPSGSWDKLEDYDNGINKERQDITGQNPANSGNMEANGVMPGSDSDSGSSSSDSGFSSGSSGSSESDSNSNSGDSTTEEPSTNSNGER